MSLMIVNSISISKLSLTFIFFCFNIVRNLNNIRKRVVLFMEIGKMINQISNRLHRRAQSVQTTFGIGATQGTILDFILVESTKRPIYQKDIECEFRLRASTVTEILKALENKGLIQRIPDKHDGRYKKIVFMEKAIDIKDLLRREIKQSESVLLKNISKDEQKQFIRIAKIMLNNLEGDNNYER